jgi:hypothetical protein
LCIYNHCCRTSMWRQADAANAGIADAPAPHARSYLVSGFVEFWAAPQPLGHQVMLIWVAPSQVWSLLWLLDP